ncbi:hypothetical protein RXV86_14580 [Alisedimentitalea sp. MJ-SS2]|uniref:alpha/beta fold hydrolase n=1 Tax=Aliisedimentitalea sp. MJ-SS2 TaxID=3049795 RepID=UPI00290DAB8B|nr:hypothetical protein [Alisedimentitalea sp. MJ-SS2]MDU8928614.1 hypothetical protein [Alisedimentitalea sp. MJ-SS2]
MVRLNEAIGAFDVSDRLDRIRAAMFYVLCDHDEFYPAAIGPEICRAMRKAETEVTYHEVRSVLGHYATTAEPDLWVSKAQSFLEGL